MITAAPSSGPRWLLADWLELEALCAKNAMASVYTLNADPLTEPDVQPAELDEDDLREDERIARATTEIRTRRESLKGAYPFEISADGARLEFHPTSEVGATTYLFCLFASHGRTDGFLHEAEVVPMAEVPDLLQACATWSAAGFENGPSYALGLDPSPGSFLRKLRTIYSLLGDGTPVATIPPGAPNAVKDDGIDVVAWQTTPHRRPPAAYMLAQVASGKNWGDKSIKPAIERFHNTWFAPAPACKANPAMMIPFCIDGGPDDDDDLDQAELAGQWRRHTSQFGELFYRYSIPHFAERGMGLHAEGTHVDMVDWREKLTDFVAKVIAKLRLEAA